MTNRICDFKSVAKRLKCETNLNSLLLGHDAICQRCNKRLGNTNQFKRWTDNLCWTLSPTPKKWWRTKKRHLTANDRNLKMWPISEYLTTASSFRTDIVKIILKLLLKPYTSKAGWNQRYASDRKVYEDLLKEVINVDLVFISLQYMIHYKKCAKTALSNKHITLMSKLHVSNSWSKCEYLNTENAVS